MSCKIGSDLKNKPDEGGECESAHNSVAEDLADIQQQKRTEGDNGDFAQEECTREMDPKCKSTGKQKCHPIEQAPGGMEALS